MNTIENHCDREIPGPIPTSSNRNPITAWSKCLAVCCGLLVATKVLAVDANLDVGDWALDSTSRTLPAVLNTAVDVGTFTFSPTGAGSLAISVNASGSGYSVAKRYVIPMRYNLWGGATINTWLKVLPAYDTGPFGANNFDLDIKVSHTMMNVRLRVAGTDGTHAATANVAVESSGVSLVTLTSASAVVTPPTAAQVFGGSVLTQIGGRVGVNATPVADAALDINGGNTAGLRIRPRTVAGAPTTGAWSKGTLIVDSAGYLYVCTADGTPGTWKKVGAP